MAIYSEYDVNGFLCHHYQKVSGIVYNTPWGRTETFKRFCDDIVFYSTCSHGGFRISSKFKKMIDSGWNRTKVWFEEDCEFAIVVYTFKQYFSDADYISAIDKLKNWYPYEYMNVTGEILTSSDSFIISRDEFNDRHKNDYIVVSAVFNKDDRNKVDVYAVIGGFNGDRNTTKRFIVDSDEYCKRNNHGFVIDLNRHEEI